MSTISGLSADPAPASPVAEDAAPAAQAALAGEHAAVYAFAVLAARVDAGSREATLAGEAYLVHRGTRDALVELLRASGEQPVAAEAAYALPEIDDVTDAARLARRVEDRCSVLLAALVAASAAASAQRRLAVEATAATAVRALAWGAAPRALPGTR